MARALKIQKYGTSQGITYGAGGVVNQPAAAVAVDEGFPNFGSLTDPVYDSAGALTSANYLGVVGGLSSAATSATYPIILPQVNIQRNNGTSTGAGNGRIIRQKGAHKFLVAKVANIQDENIIAGNSYLIVSNGGTNWAQFGAGVNAGPGDVFTATISGSSAVVANGVVWDVGICVLQNSATPTAGYMSIEFSVGDSAGVFASYVSNKWIRDWNGMTYGNYNPSNIGLNIQSGEHFYPTNFFSDEGTVTWSGAEIINGAQAQNGSLQLAQVVKSTS